jgi:H+/Cl- antiporter ClcA
MLTKSANRPKIYQEWEIGKEYSNFEYSTTKLDGGDINFQTVFSLRDSLRVIFNSIVTGVITFVLWYLYIAGDYLEVAVRYRTLFFILVTSFVVGLLFYVGKNVRTYFKKAFIEVPIEILENHYLNRYVKRERLIQVNL